jgi:hypothetical protein
MIIWALAPTTCMTNTNFGLDFPHKGSICVACNATANTYAGVKKMPARKKAGFGWCKGRIGWLFEAWSTTMAKKAKKSRKPADISKSAQIISLLKRANGASIPELMKITTWQAHSVRGFMSGTLKTKRGLLITSEQTEDKDRRYKIAGAS